MGRAQIETVRALRIFDAARDEVEPSGHALRNSPRFLTPFRFDSSAFAS